MHVTAVSTLSGHDQPVVCFLSPVSGSGNIWRRPKSANNAAIQHVAPPLSEETLQYGDIKKKKQVIKKKSSRPVRTNATAADGKGCSLSGRGRMFMATTSPILVQKGPQSSTDKAKLKSRGRHITGSWNFAGTKWTLTRTQEYCCFHWWACSSSPRGWSWWGTLTWRRWCWQWGGICGWVKASKFWLQIQH